MSILEELYYGNLHPSEKCFDDNSRYAQLAKIVADNEDALSAFINAQPNAQKEQHLLSQMINAQGELNQFSEIEQFIEGFRLGASIMLDTFIVPQQSVIRDIC